MEFYSLKKKTSPCSCLYSCNSRSLFMRHVSGSKADRPACNVEWYLVVRISLWNIRPLRTSHFQFELAPKTGTLQLIGNSISSPINRGGLSIGYRCIVLTAICFEFCLELIIACQNLLFFILNAWFEIWKWLEGLTNQSKVFESILTWTVEIFPFYVLDTSFIEAVFS